MDEKILVNYVLALVNDYSKRSQSFTLVMLIPTDPMVIDSKYTLLVSAPWLDNMSPKDAVTIILGDLRNRILPNDFSAYSQIARVTVIKTNDPFVNAITSAFNVHQSDMALTNCNINGVLIERAILLESHREELKMRRENKADHLTEFNAIEFFENMSEFSGYIANRQKQAKLNPDKLINLLYIYFRSVLLYPSPDKREYYVTEPKGRLYKIEFPGHTIEGEKRPVSLGEMSNTLLAEVCSDLLKSAHMDHIISLVELFTKAIATPSL